MPVEPVPGTGVRLREVECRSLLTPSALADYCLNCYRGCGHGCLYCYAQFVTRFSHPQQPWGSFVDIKVNAAAVLEREVAWKRPGRVFVSSVCDAWQPVEARLGLTRRCLEFLRHRRFPVTILTKSPRAERDLDVLQGWDGVEFGVTITTLDEGLRRIFEPRAAPSSCRLSLLEAARRRGLRTYAFLGPLLPGVGDGEEAIARLVAAVVEAGVSYFFVDRLNLRHRVWSTLSPALRQHFPELVPEFRSALFQREGSSLYSHRLFRRASAVARRLGVDDRLRFCF